MEKINLDPNKIPEGKENLTFKEFIKKENQEVLIGKTKEVIKQDREEGVNSTGEGRKNQENQERQEGKKKLFQQIDENEKKIFVSEEFINHQKIEMYINQIQNILNNYQENTVQNYDFQKLKEKFIPLTEPTSDLNSIVILSDRIEADYSLFLNIYKNLDLSSFNHLDKEILQSIKDTFNTDKKEKASFNKIASLILDIKNSQLKKALINIR